MKTEQQQKTLRRVGAMWKPKPGAKSLGSGSLSINGLRQRFVIFKNDRKQAGSQQPDYLLMSGDEPEQDVYARQPTGSATHQVAAGHASAQPTSRGAASAVVEDVEDLPF